MHVCLCVLVIMSLVDIQSLNRMRGHVYIHNCVINEMERIGDVDAQSS